MADLKKLADTLHPLERKILPMLPKYSLISDLTKYSALKEVEVSRALQWLRNKNIIDLKEDLKELVSLDRNGIAYLKSGLPERRFLSSLNREMSLKEVEKLSKLSKEEVSVCIGILKKKNAINISKKGNDVLVSLTDVGRNILKKDTLEESFLKKSFPLDPKSLSSEEKYALQELGKRKNIVNISIQKTKVATLTLLGTELLQLSGSLNKEVIDSLSQDIIKNKTWMNKEFRGYDLKAQVPRVSHGKKHFENEVIDYVKSIWLDMGFKEMSGSMVQTALWDLDALFVPQDHPAREMQDTFYLKRPSEGHLPDDIKKKIKAIHENGGDTGSKGWGGEWSEKLAKKNLLVTHDTFLSAQILSKLKKEDLPIKTFQILKVFRNEAADWNHLFEFYQVGGIVVDPNATFDNLKGYLQEFFRKMGYEKVMIRPAHFPYTEPSAEILVFDQNRQQWIELGGSGMFRPEVVKPLLGFECPVLAWGFGLGRISAPYYKIQDLRDFNKNDIKQLRSMKKWLMMPR
jgi:phenylalanyl-tRNA synthetase alpha chain